MPIDVNLIRKNSIIKDSNNIYCVLDIMDDEVVYLVSSLKKLMINQFKSTASKNAFRLCEKMLYVGESLMNKISNENTTIFDLIAMITEKKEDESGLY